MIRLFILCSLVAATACAGSRPAQTPPTSGEAPGTAGPSGPMPAWVQGEMPDPYDEATHLMVVGEGETVEAARTDAQDKMVVEVLGPDSSRPFITIPDDLQEFAYAPGTEQYSDPTSGRVYVRLIAQRVFIVDRLKAWEATMAVGALPDETPDAYFVGGEAVTDPSTHLEALTTTLGYRRASAFVCGRRMAVTTSTCTPRSLAPIRRAVKTFGRALQIRALYSDGVPYRTGRGPQVPVAVGVVWKAPGRPPVPVSGLPLEFKEVGAAAAPSATAGGDGPRAEMAAEAPAAGSEAPPAEIASDAPAPPAPPSVRTDDRGVARWRADGLEQRARVAVRLHAEAVLGPEAPLWATLPAIEVGFRALEAKSARLALMVKESRGDRGRRGLQQKLVALGLTLPVDLPDGMKAVFADPSNPPDADKLRAMAEASDGTIDLVAVGDMHSQFASRMGARSVWHEARGKLIIYDLWSGAVIGPLEGTERAVAIGDRAASAKALEALGERLAEDAAKLLTEHYRVDASAGR